MSYQEACGLLQSMPIHDAKSWLTVGRQGDLDEWLCGHYKWGQIRHEIKYGDDDEMLEALLEDFLRPRGGGGGGGGAVLVKKRVDVLPRWKGGKVVFENEDGKTPELSEEVKELRGRLVSPADDDVVSAAARCGGLGKDAVLLVPILEAVNKEWRWGGYAGKDVRRAIRLALLMIREDCEPFAKWDALVKKAGQDLFFWKWAAISCGVGWGLMTILWLTGGVQ